VQEEIPSAFLEELYDKIVRNEIKMEVDGVMFGSAEKKVRPMHAMCEIWRGTSSTASLCVSIGPTGMAHQAGRPHSHVEEAVLHPHAQLPLLLP
jgi:hypothetical protein